MGHCKIEGRFLFSIYLFFSMIGMGVEWQLLYHSLLWFFARANEIGGFT